MKKSTIKDVAALSGFSTATVSRVINNNPGVTPDAVSRIQDAMKELNYHPNPIARSMRTGSVKTIGLILPNLSDPFFGSIANHIIMNAEKFQFNVLIQVSKSEEDYDEPSCFRKMLDAAVDGLIYCSISRVVPQEFEQYFSGIPVVVCSRHHLLPGRPHVYFDHQKGGYLATKYLLEMGHRKICLFAGVYGFPFHNEEDLKPFLENPLLAGPYSGIDKYIGFRQALTEKNVEFHPELLEFGDLGNPYETGYLAMQRLISKTTDFDAVFCANDFSATGAIHMLNTQRIDVPNVVSIVGYDDGILATCAQPQLTSVVQNTAELGYQCVNSLHRLFDGEEVADTQIDVHLVVRQSSCNHSAPQSS